MTHRPLTAKVRSMSPSLSKALAAGILLALSIGLLNACSQTDTKSESDSSDVSSNKTEFTATPEAAKSNFDAVSYNGPTFTLATPDGSTMTFTDMLGQGKPLVVNFWGTWCGPCRREMPEFVRIYQEYEGLQLVGIALRDTPEKVTAYTTQKGIKWPMVIGNMKTVQDFGGISGVPTTIIYDSQGLELSRYVGPMSYEMFKERLDEAFSHETEIASL